MVKPLKSVTYGQCNTNPLFTFPATGYNSRLTGSKFFCLVTEAHGCKQLAQGCCLKTDQLGVKPAAFELRVQRPYHYATRPLQTYCSLGGVCLWCAAVVENLTEVRPEACVDAGQQGVVQWLLKRIRVRCTF